MYRWSLPHDRACMGRACINSCTKTRRNQMKVLSDEHRPLLARVTWIACLRYNDGFCVASEKS
jgi:hypothetical protein